MQIHLAKTVVDECPHPSGGLASNLVPGTFLDNSEHQNTFLPASASLTTGHAPKPAPGTFLDNSEHQNAFSPGRPSPAHASTRHANGSGVSY
jgi:hypothetical protein